MAKVEAITSFPVSTTRGVLRRFLGMTGYYRWFCRNFSSVAAPLTDLVAFPRKMVSHLTDGFKIY